MVVLLPWAGLECVSTLTSEKNVAIYNWKSFCRINISCREMLTDLRGEGTDWRRPCTQRARETSRMAAVVKCREMRKLP